ncbi:hypothetical protein KCH_29450 [Kitasatospora cheerisanensis KCTC 2395]|uniref:Uncharacterized protein n=1 Tax=Kitasatospora cheerisanensis KCTC 2395 TaxID=1348663 RepID=A0A066YZE6_9ACTN|nr:hypothetical protein KCH_29450 [Kitasatospora cheerisanensis KCTC 2395]
MFAPGRGTGRRGGGMTRRERTWSGPHWSIGLYQFSATPASARTPPERVVHAEVTDK